MPASRIFSRGRAFQASGSCQSAVSISGRAAQHSRSPVSALFAEASTHTKAPSRLNLGQKAPRKFARKKHGHSRPPRRGRILGHTPTEPTHNRPTAQGGSISRTGLPVLCLCGCQKTTARGPDSSIRSPHTHTHRRRQLAEGRPTTATATKASLACRFHQWDPPSPNPEA